MYVIEMILWVCVAVLLYTYFGYPLLIRVWSALCPYTRGRMHRGSEPMITVVIVACNEARIIRKRLENILESDYPSERLQVILASDGSTDTTMRRAEKIDSSLIKLISFPDQRGKAAVLNDVIPQAAGDIVVLADARQRFDKGALRALASDFEFPSVGAVSGELVLTRNLQRSEAGEGVGFYWQYEKFIRRHESRTDSTVGATGAIYAIRRRLFRPISPAAILDDVLIPMQIARRGYRVLFEPRARAYERIADNASREFQRKLRTIAGNFQMFYLAPWLLNPLQNRLWLQTISHKGARLLSPLCLLAVLVANCFLLSMAGYRYLLGIQVFFYIAALAGYILRRSRIRHAVINVPYTFCLLNIATVAALVSLLRGRQKATWAKPKAGL